jgi:membrane-associated phospholipid phosphatase
LSSVRRAMLACAVLAVAFVLQGASVALGASRAEDRYVSSALAQIWNPHWQGLFQAVAVLGGLEITCLLAVGLFVYLRRIGFRAESWVVVALPVAALMELIYKHTIYQPSPPSHADGPSLSMLVGSTGSSSYPSGHMVRTVLVYGLLAFVVRRLAPWRWARWLAPVLASVMIAAMAFDRLYLGVHWQSDVVGGLLLGGLALVAAITWLEQPWRSNKT